MNQNPAAVVDVSAKNLRELGFAQGRQTASIRGADLESDRLHLEATSGTSFDEFSRRSMLATTARLAFDKLDGSTQEFVAAYSAGVDAGLDSLDRRSGSWQPWTPLGVFSVHNALFGSAGHELWKRHVLATMGPEGVDALTRENPALSGSNAWVAGGARAASSAPLIGADPHRILTVPGVYQRVRLRTDDFDVVGLTIAGAPGVQHFGHTGSVAWAITNAMADNQDLIDVTLRRDDVEDVEVNFGSGWESCDVDDDVIATRLGPVVIGGQQSGPAIVLRTPPWVLRDLGFSALLPLLRAHTAADVSAAFDTWVDPVNDVLIADVEGTVLHRTAGQVPQRNDAGDWTGWREHGLEQVGKTEIVVAANQRRPAPWPQLGSEYAAPYRAERIEELLADRFDLTVDDAVAVHLDTLLPNLGPWKMLLRKAPIGQAQAAGVRDIILDWSGRMDASSRGAAAFAATRSALVQLLAESEEFAPLRNDSGLPSFFDPWLVAEPRIAAALDRWLVEGAPYGLDLASLLGQALQSVGAKGYPKRWGDTHIFGIDQQHWVPLSGDNDCVLSTSSLPGISDRAWRGPVARVVWSLADRGQSRWIVPDALQMWSAGKVDAVDEQADASNFWMRPVEPDRDAPMIWDWVTKERAEFWGMTDKSLEEVREIYAYLDSLETHHAYLVHNGDQPVLILQTYDPFHDPIGEAYDVQEGDLGVHAFIADGDPVPGFTGRLMTYCMGVLFSDPAVKRLVGEPDVRNEKSRARVERSGAAFGEVVELANKRAQMAFYPRPEGI